MAEMQWSFYEITEVVYDPENELTGSMLIDLQSGNEDRGICGLPFTRQSDNQTVYIPMNIIGNLYVSNGMSAGNTRNEARVQGLSEVFERYVKNRIIAESISLPEIPADVLARYPAVVEAIETLARAAGANVVARAAILAELQSVHRKDILNAKHYAHKLGVDLPLTDVVLHVMDWMNDNGHIDEDQIAMVKYYEDKMDVQVGKEP